MRVAALYDVHGNLPALEAVLAEVERADVDRVVFGGDLVSGPWPGETLERARSLGGSALFLAGNTEPLVLDGDADEDRWARERLTEEQRAFVAAWPSTVSLEVDGCGAVLFCHATPRDAEEVVSPASAPERWEEALEGVEAAVVVCGHTHLQYDGVFAGRRVVNPGSVGKPSVRAAAWWAILGPDVDLRATDYDTGTTVAAARARGYPAPLGDLLEPLSRERALARLAELEA